MFRQCEDILNLAIYFYIYNLKVSISNTAYRNYLLNVDKYTHVTPGVYLTSFLVYKHHKPVFNDCVQPFIYTCIHLIPNIC